jgi:hypothetical protein
MNPQNPFLILESPLSFLQIIRIIPHQTLSQQIQTMQMMQSLDVSRVAAAVFGGDLDLGWEKAGLGGEVNGDDCAAVWELLGGVQYCGWGMGTGEERNGDRRGEIQSTPRDCHAASTSGDAGCRKMFSFMREPLKRWMEKEISTSSSTGAAPSSANVLSTAHPMHIQ